MPLHGQREPIIPSVFERFDQTVGGPGCRQQVASNRFDGLVMMAIHQRLLRIPQGRQAAFG